MAKQPHNKALGRGLAELLADDEAETTQRESTLPIDVIVPNPAQPRRHFDPDLLDELAASIRERGVIQPLIVRPDPGKQGRYQIVAGERRWRAAQKAQLHEVPVVIRDLDDAQVLELAIIENIQRTDLNPVEEARGFAQLIEQFGHTQEKLAEAMGKSRSYIANALRLLTLPQSVLDHLAAGRLSAGHARALITAEDPAALAERVIAQGLSVRETERLVKDQKTKATAAPKPRVVKDPDTLALEADLSASIGLPVKIEHKGEKGGEVRLRYASLEELDGICQLLSR
ncbi:ParB/RepB/Spo0J family partition protein [Oceanicella actignis]|uniref:ParB/RepB/Spo0J family partition protein n=1 Tax=Oceanicella actignis TaxID=1189325 RepID=UPI0011E7A848|nr:ParB/RepB/Spo0J family partition protein [Oceanicella actignis]TYO88872.1 ParB family chromosome partitioning protein [Oceanicella actignis]